MADAIAQAYSSSQNGGELPYFVGKQYGGGWLRNLARVAFPILKRIVGVATNTAEDVIVRDKKVLDSLKDNSLNEIGRMAGQPPINMSRKRKNVNGTIFAPKRRR